MGVASGLMAAFAAYRSSQAGFRILYYPNFKSLWKHFSLPKGFKKITNVPKFKKKIVLLKVKVVFLQTAKV